MEDYFGFYKELFEGKLFGRLSAPAKLFYMYLKCEYSGSNNGEIRLLYRDMENVKGCSTSTTIKKAIRELEEKGWIEVERRGSLYRHNNHFRLTFKYDKFGYVKY